MNFDPGILVYLIFLAIILYSNHRKKRRQARERAVQLREIEVQQPEPVAVAVPVRQSLHDQRLERQLQTQRAAALEEAPRAPVVVQQAVHRVAKRMPIEAARFRTRDDLRRAIVARVVLAPPKSLDS